MAANRGTRARRRQRSGISLMEVLLVMTLLGILASLGVPSLGRGLEQSRVDLAAADLRSISAAERAYWLEYRTYTTTLPTLVEADLVDARIAAAPADARLFYYEIVDATASAFTVRATRTGSSLWAGQLELDQTGALTGSITGGGFTVLPSFR
ncbi:MAG: prepilin-type N-terminal cleavage/methylation domain-containing protein [Planctomycetes bacterium]|nr:prepilin-type N-terminal cleavage/methylation domain-containing protein [Planctomycetota bacterium]